MADLPDLKADKKVSADLKKEAISRREECKATRAHIRQDIEECYFFVAPRRHRQAKSSGGSQTPPKDAPELQTSLGMDVVADFATEVIDTFMPKTQDWADLKPGYDLPDKQQEEIREDMLAANAMTFTAMRASNLYDALAMSAKPDLALGTMALWIDDLDQSRPIDCRAVPQIELEIDVGPDGKIGTRFVIRRTKRRYLPAVLPNVPLPGGYSDDKDGKKDCTVAWGFWPTYGRPEMTWQAVIMVDDHLVQARELVGEGSCPLIVARWDPDPCFAWGDGPTLKALPDLRALDETEALKVESADFAIHKPFGYPDDGVVNFEAGVEPGFGYPMRPGSGKDFVPLGWQGNVDFAQFTVMEKEQRVRRLHYVDFPVQRGDTPPSATQWADEMALRQKRFGQPGQTFWREGPCEIVKRFMFILAKRGRLPKIEVNGQALALVPYNAAEAAKDMQDIATGQRLLSFITSVAPDVSQVLVDQEKTFRNMKTKMRDQVVEFRDAAGVKQALEQFAPLLQGGGAAPEGAPPA